MLGYVDPLFYLPAIAGLALAYFRRPVWAGACVAVAVCTKPQAILIGPADSPRTTADTTVQRTHT